MLPMEALQIFRSLKRIYKGTEEEHEIITDAIRVLSELIKPEPPKAA